MFTIVLIWIDCKTVVFRPTKLVFDHHRCHHVFDITEASMVLSSDSEEVLCILSETRHSEVDELGHTTFDPFLLALLQSFHQVAGNPAAAVVLWFSPDKRHTFLGNISHTQLWWRAWFFWK